MRTINFLFTTSAVAILVATASAPALAQTDPSSRAGVAEPVFDEVVVTARKRVERLIDIPESVQVIASEKIERAGVYSVNDISRLATNVVLNRRQDNEPNVVIRGVGSFGNTQGIGFFIDDVQNFTDKTASIEDVERIEILKGPQGTLYGGSNVGGAIKYVLRQPEPEFGASFKGELGDFGTSRLFAAVNAPLTSDGELLARVSGYRNKTDGFVPNTNIGGNPGESLDSGVRVAVRWAPTDVFTGTLNYRHNEVNNGGNIYVPAVDTDDYQRTVAYNQDPFNKTSVDGLTLSLEADTGGVIVTSLSSYTRRTNSLLWDLDYSAADVIYATEGDRNKTSVYTQEVRLASDTADNFEWLVGGYYAQINDLSLLATADLFFGLDAGGPSEITNFQNGTTTENQYALFGNASYRFGDFKVGGGLRLGRSEFTGTVLNSPASSVDVNDNVLLPKLTLSYDVTSDMLLYANIARGYEPGRTTTDQDRPLAYRSEQSTSYEVGVKGQSANRKFSYDLAMFYLDYSDRQLESNFVDPVSSIIVTQITNIGDSTSYGLEAGLSYRPTPELTISGSAGYLKSEWNDSNAQFNFIDVDGLEVANSPDFSGNMSVDYKRPVSDNYEIGARVDLSHQGSFFWDVLNTSEQDSYQLMNARLSFGDINSGWEFAIRAENLLDTEYYDEFFPDIFAPGQSLGAPGRPRSYMASFRVKL